MVAGRDTMKALLLLATMTLTACHLPNPYDTSPYPRTPAPTPPSGEPPQVPAPPPAEPQPAPETPVETEPQRPVREYQLSAASKALVTQAHSQAASGDVTTAAATIERALRIEPSNPLLWIELGRLREREGSYAQAESLGRKALSLATGDARVQSQAWQLIADALRSRGKAVEAREADLRAQELSPR
jgi:Flp pilus assembly protein TadD